MFPLAQAIHFTREARLARRPSRDMKISKPNPKTLVYRAQNEEKKKKAPCAESDGAMAITGLTVRVHARTN